MVHKISRGVKLKVFDLWQCYRQMQAQASRMSALAGDGGGDSASMVVGGHLAPAISHATAAEGNVQSLVFIRIHIFPKTQFCGKVFYALSHGVIRFAQSVSTFLLGEIL